MPNRHPNAAPSQHHLLDTDAKHSATSHQFPVRRVILFSVLKEQDQLGRAKFLTLMEYFLSRR